MAVRFFKIAGKAHYEVKNCARAAPAGHLRNPLPWAAFYNVGFHLPREASS